MPPVEYWDDEEYYSHQDRISSSARHVPSRRARDDNYGRRSDFLTPERQSSYSTGLHRTRSQGHAPAPNINIYATSRLENESNPRVHTEQKSREPSPAAPRGRPMRLQDDWTVEDEIKDIRMQLAANRRSRSRSDVYRDSSRSPTRQADYDRWKLQQVQEQLKDAEEKAALEKREESLKKKMELKYLKEKLEREEEEALAKAQQDRVTKEMELKYEREERQRAQRARDAEEERKRIIAENTAKIEKAEREAKAQQQAAVDAFNKRKAEEEKAAKDERDRILADYERQKFADAEKAKRERERVLMEVRIEEEKQRAREKEEWERFLRKQKQIEEEEEEKKKKQEEDLNEAMRKRLAQFGFQDNQIQAMIRPEDAAKLQQQQQLTQGSTPLNPLRLTQQPTYAKVHKEHLAVDTLLYYDIPYEIDRADPNYYIILREMDSRETEVLFEHTRRLRNRGTTRLLIEERRDRNDKPDYAWVRRRAPSRSPSRRRSSPKRTAGISDLFIR